MMAETVRKKKYMVERKKSGNKEDVADLWEQEA